MPKGQKAHTRQGKREKTRAGKVNIAWKEITLLIFFLLLVGILSAFYFAQGKGPVRTVVVEGAPAPEFRLPALDGKLLSLSDFRGKVVMVHFWATWCPPCVEEIPTLETLYRKFINKDFEILAVSVDEGGAPAVTGFADRNGLSFPLLLDPGKSISGLYGTYKFPETYLVDQQGIVRYKAIGPRDWTNPANVKVVQDLIEAR